jgi:hypothetical protein
MVEVADIKKDLPGWPDDVIKQWLHYFANEPDGGWPPPDPLGEHRWRNLLGGRPLSWWKNVTWERQAQACTLDNLSPNARASVVDIVNTVNGGKADPITKRRFDHAFNYILNNAAFPKPLITMKPPAGLILLDGSHRMAAFCALQKMPNEKFEALKLKKAVPQQELWLGTHSAGEFPN